MKVKELLNIDGFTLLTPTLSLEEEMKEVCISDLLSWVLGKVKEDRYVLITILNSMNVLAVASLLNCSAVVFCDRVQPTEEMIQKAVEEDIPLFTFSCSNVEAVRRMDRYESLL